MDDDPILNGKTNLRATIIFTNGDKSAVSENVAAQQTYGICLSGGGSPATCAAAGFIRGLVELGYYEKNDYMVGVSGGAFASTILSYATQPVKTIVGSSAKSVSEISLLSLQMTQPQSLMALFQKPVIPILEKLDGQGYPEDEIWIRAAGQYILEPYGLGNMNKYFSSDPSEVQEIIEENNHGLSADDFYIMFRPKPYPIAMATLFWPTETLLKENMRPVEQSPKFVGIQKKSSIYATNVASQQYSTEVPKHIVGGGYLQPFAFNSETPISSTSGEHQQLVTIQKPSRPYSLADMIGSSSAVFAKIFNKFPGKCFKSLSPRFLYWRPNSMGYKMQDAYSYSIGDGGNFENLGVIPMLSRQVDNLVILVNSDTPFKVKYSWLFGRTVKVDGHLAPLFGLTSWLYPKCLTHDITQVFYEDDYAKLLAAFEQKLDRGEPLCVQTKFEIKDNDLLGISNKKEDGSTYQPNIIWLYVNKSKLWEQALNPEFYQELKTNKEFEQFPNYNIFGPQFAFFKPSTWEQFGVLKPEQSNLLAEFTSWCVRYNKKMFEGFFK